MKKRTIIELTAFVDILLILLFAFLFNISETNQKANLAENQSTKLAQENLELKNDLQNVSSNYAGIKDENEKLKQQNKFYENYYNELSKNIEKAFENYDLPEGISEESLVEIKRMIENEDINLDYVIKNEGLMENFFVLDIIIQGEKPEILFNEENIDFSINYEQYNSGNSRNKKLNNLTENIDDKLRENGIPQMIYITIKQNDEDVYLFAYNLLMESIKRIQNKYGADRVYFTEIPFLFQ